MFLNLKGDRLGSKPPWRDTRFAACYSYCSVGPASVHYTSSQKSEKRIDVTYPQPRSLAGAGFTELRWLCVVSVCA
jgi:hypothetical protein